MPHPPSIDWAALDATYTDEFGQIDADVYAAAEEIWQPAQAFAQRVLAAEPARAHTLLMKAAANVTRARVGQVIDNLPAYLFQSFKNLVRDERKALDNRERLHELWREEQELRSEAEAVERRILFGELARIMDDWTRRVFQLRALDYSFEEIAAELHTKPEVIRNRFNRNLHRLIKRLGERSER